MKLRRSWQSAQRSGPRGPQRNPKPGAATPAGRSRGTEPDLLRHLQASIGNRAVDDMVQRGELGASARQSRLAIQRDEPKEGAGGGGAADSGAGGGVTYTVKTKDIHPPEPIKTEFVDIKPHVQAELKITMAADPNGATPGDRLSSLATDSPKKDESATQVRAGGTSTQGQGVGVDAEITHEWEDTRLPGMLSSFHPAAKLGAESNEKEAKVAFEGSLEGHDWKPTAELALVKGDWDTGEVNFLSADFGADLELASYEHTFSDGAKASITPTVKPRLEFSPDWSGLGKWIARSFGEAAVEFLLGAGGLVLGGVATVGLFLLTLSDGDKEVELINGGMKRMKSFVDGFVGEATGTWGGGGDDDEWNGHLHGMKWVEEGMKKIGGIPYPGVAVREAAKDTETKTAGITKKARQEIRPQLREDITKAYWEYHWVMKRLLGGDLPGVFKAQLDESLGE